MNRILQFIGSDCECCRARRTAERWAAVAAAIQAAIGGTDVVEMVVPSAAFIADGHPPRLSVDVVHPLEPCLDLDDARAHTRGELLSLASKLTACANRLDDEEEVFFDFD